MARETDVTKSERIARILVFLIRNKNRSFTSQQLREQLEQTGQVSLRNVQRDLEILARPSLGECVVRQRRQGTVVYGIAPDMRSKLDLPIEKNSLLVLFLLKRLQPLLAPNAKTLQDLQEAMDALTDKIDDEIFDDLDEQLRRTTHVLGGQALLSLEGPLLNDLLTGLVEHRKLSILYQRQYGRPPEEKVICPVKLVLSKGELYFLCMSEYYENRDFFIKLSRIASARVTGDSFVPKPERVARMEARLSKSFGMLDEDNPRPERIVLRFPSYFNLILRERIFHPTQQVSTAKSGEVVLTMDAPVGDELAKWVLSWLGDATVVKPRALRVLLRKVGTMLTERYS